MLALVAVLAALVLLLPLGAAAFHRRFSARRYQGPVSDHFDGERFHNLERVPDKTFGDILRWRREGGAEPWPAWIASEPGPPPEASVAGGALRATLVNHATVLLQMDGLNLLTDPVWSERVSPVPWAGPRRRRAPGLRLEEVPPLDAVLLSHNHYDHLDVPTLRQLAARGPAPILTGLGNAEYLARFGVADERSGRVRELDWGDEQELPGGVRVVALPARHWSSRSPWDRARSLWCSWVIEGPSGRVYVAGDSGYGGHFAAIGAAYGPFRLALLPIGAFLPRWFMRDNHMAPDEALRVAEELRAETSIVVHYGTFPLGDDGPDTPLAELRVALERAGGGAPRIVALEHGVGYDVPPFAIPAPRAASPEASFAPPG